ncbi:MAG: ABC transporter transmembrane domain-containing protein [Pseudomonadota bacterium]
MESGFFSFVWRYSKRDQMIILLLTVISFPLVYLSLEIPKIIINEAISGTDFPKDIAGFLVDQIPYLLLLCGLYLLLVVAINAIKWAMNVQIGMTGERMLRRLRYMLFERVMRFRIQRFRSSKPGEVIQSILGEIEPLGGFIGEVLATPCFQGGLLVVYVSFIFVQDWILGLAAIALYPIQAWIIPILQRKIVRLNKERAANTRKLADTIGESVNVINEIHTNATPRWHMAQVAGRLYENTAIRLQLFRRKFTIKFVNNFMNHLTPFFFYSAGGYLVIKGDLDFGSLVAVLAAYKDVAAPWKAVLNYVQRWADFNSRFVFVVENFSGDDVLPDHRIYQSEQDGPALSGALEYRSVEGGPGTGGLTASNVTIEPGRMVAVLGGNNGAREAFLKLAAGLSPPFRGVVTLGGLSLIDQTLPQIGRAIAYVGAEPGIVARSLKDNLLYGLFHESPDLANADIARTADMLREAKLTGNTTSNPEGDWIDYTQAGVDGPEALERRLMDLIEIVDHTDDVYATAMGMRLNPKIATEWTDEIMAARSSLHASAIDLGDIVEDWSQGRFNSSGSLLENLLYGLPTEGRDDHADYYDLPKVHAVLDGSDAVSLLEEIGFDIAKEFSELVDTLGDNSAVLDSLAGYDRGDVLSANDLIIATAGQTEIKLLDEDKVLMIKLAMRYVQGRDRLDVLDDARIQKVLECRTRARALTTNRDDFVSFEEERFSPARSIAGNIVHGKRRFDRRSAWKSLDKMIHAAIDKAGLMDDLIRLGLGRPIPSGNSLSASHRRRIGLVRGMIKQPEVLILDGIAAGDSDQDVRLRAAIRQDLPSTTIIYGALEEDATKGADLIVRISENGEAICAPPSIRGNG